MDDGLPRGSHGESPSIAICNESTGMHMAWRLAPSSLPPRLVGLRSRILLCRAQQISFAMARGDHVKTISEKCYFLAEDREIAQDGTMTGQSLKIE